MSEKFTYENYFTPNVKKFAEITLNEVNRKKLATAIGMRIRLREQTKGRKLLESEVKIYEKIYMQTAGDLVLEQYLRLDNVVKYDQIFDDKRVSFINDLLPSRKIDVVTFNYGLFPMVYKKTYRKTIFVCMLSKTNFYICGIGGPEIINGFSNDTLLTSQYYRLNGRTAFYGFDRLTPLSGHLGEFLRIIS